MFEDRLTLEDFRIKHGLRPTSMRMLFGAALRITCRSGIGSGALVGENGVFLTAEHVVDERNPSRDCRVQSLFGGPIYRIDPDAYFRGSDFRRDAEADFEKDIFIGRLVGGGPRPRP